MTMKSRSFISRMLALLLVLALGCGTLLSCTPAEEQPPAEEDDPIEPTPDKEPDEQPDDTPTTPDDTPDQEQEEENAVDYKFKYDVSEEVLCNYLARAVTISPESSGTLSLTGSRHVKKFILNTGAKYICRAATCWAPHPGDYGTYPGQKAFIEDVHKSDPDVVFEACVFECISTAVNEISIPAWVFEAFGREPEDRCFSFEAMCFPDGSYKNQWGANTSVPDITRDETMLFLFYRACEYINIGYEGLHMGQIHLIGKNDTGWERWTELLAMIRDYATEHARRHFVFINAHTHGIIGADDVLLFDFHMYPSRPMADGEQEAHFPTEDEPQYAYFKAGHSDSIYGKSLGGETYSGWTCDSLPYLVELDNYGNDAANLHVPRPADMRTWGMDEITWYCNQPAWYREEFLEYAYAWVREEAGGKGFFAMPGERVASYYAEDGQTVTKWRYYGYDPKNFKQGCGDEAFIKRIFEEYTPKE